MKRTILTLALLLCATGAFAQKKTEPGIKGGLNIARSYSGEGSSKARFTGHAGLFSEFYMGQRLGVQVELLYSMQGERGKEDGMKVTVKMDYINMPVMFKIYLNNRLTSIDIGPQVGYMVLCKGKGKEDGISATIDAYDQVDNKFDLSIGIGMSERLTRNLDMFFRYNLGLLKPFDGSNGKHMVFSFGMGYRF